MKEFYVDFSGYLTVQAESADEAEQKTWDWINAGKLPEGFFNDVWDIDCIEEIKE